MLDGGDGNNTYLFGKGDGTDVIQYRYDGTAYTGDQFGKLNTLQFKAGVSVANVTTSRTGDNLIFKILGLDSVTVQRFFSNNNPKNSDNPIQQVKFADGTTWNLDFIASSINTLHLTIRIV